MPIGVEAKLAAPEMSLDTPAGQTTRQLHHVGLGVAAPHTQRVELHHLAAVILIRGRFLIGLVVKVDEHGRRVGGRHQQIREVAQRVLPHNVSVVHHLEEPAVPLGKIDVEVIGPEFDHPLEQLPRAVLAPEHCGPAELVDDGIPLPIRQHVGLQTQGVKGPQAQRHAAVVQGLRGQLSFDPCRQPVGRRLLSF
jgi:hypothetical protein